MNEWTEAHIHDLCVDELHADSAEPRWQAAHCRTCGEALNAADYCERHGTPLTSYSGVKFCEACAPEETD